MPGMKFTLQSTFVLIFVLGLMLGWYVDRSRLAKEVEYLDNARMFKSDCRSAMVYEQFLQSEGYTVTRSGTSVTVSGAWSSVSFDIGPYSPIRCGPAPP